MFGDNSVKLFGLGVRQKLFGHFLREDNKWIVDLQAKVVANCIDFLPSPRHKSSAGGRNRVGAGASTSEAPFNQNVISVDVGKERIVATIIEDHLDSAHKGTLSDEGIDA